MNLPQHVDGVNIFCVNTTNDPAARPYHHGDLRNALVDAAVELARVGGPGAIVLREAARRVGVSPNAAYRHFDGLPDLANAVAEVAMAAMAASMLAEQARLGSTGEPTRDAVTNLLAVGRGYVHFALAEPGLFASAFVNPKELPWVPAGEPAATPGELLQRALDGLISAELLKPDSLPFARATAWAAVHGLSTLLLGPMSAVPSEERSAFIDSCLHLVAFGLLSRE